MADVKWIKIVTDIFDDEKILLIESMPEADSLIVIWFKLLCLAGKQNNSGVFLMNDKIAYTEEMLATIFRRPLNTVRLALQTFEAFGMIEMIDGVVTIPNWGKHQHLEQMETYKEHNAKYMREYRAKQKQALLNAKNEDVTNDVNNSKVTVRGTDKNRLEEDKTRLEENTHKEAKSSRFVPPSVSEVKAYCLERHNTVDAEEFVDFYTSNGWKVGKNSMKDWKAAVRTWERRHNDGIRDDSRKNETATSADERWGIRPTFDANRED